MKAQSSGLIQNIVDFLHLLQENGLEADQVVEQGLEALKPVLLPTQEMQHTWELLRFMNEMPGGFLMYYAYGKEEIIYANRALQCIAGCKSMAEFRAYTGNSFRGLIHPEDLEEVEESIQAQIGNSSQDLDYVEYRIIRTDGAIRWIEDYGHFVRSETTGDVFCVFLGDATERREQRRLAEVASLLDEKRRGEERLRALAEEYSKERDQINQEQTRRMEVILGLGISYDSIFYVDLDKDQVLPYLLGERIAPAFEREQKVRPYSDVRRIYCNTWVHPEDRDVFTRATEPDYIREKLAESKSIYLNYRVIQEEKPIYLQLRLVDVGKSGRVSQVMMAYRRVDEEVRSEMEQRELLAEALEKANLAVKAKDTFLSHISHDMRTPLNAIFGFLTLAKMSCGDPMATQDYLDRMEEASHQLLDMITQALEVSALSGDVRPVETACDLCATVQEAFNSLRLQARGKSLLFELDCQGVRQSAVYADRERLRQLVFSLTNNAVSYTRPGGSVRVQVSQKESLPNDYAAYCLEVSDTGIGIDASFLKEMYEPFSREKNSTLSGVHGVGLGLTIVKSIVDMMGGTIDVHSVVGEGTTFTVTLHLRTQEDTPQKEADSIGPVQKILLVEDNEINSEIETELLEQVGFSVEAAENGKVALEKMEQASPGDIDLILMDIQMPVMDGWEAARAVRDLPDPALAQTPIIALSANALDSDRRKSEECGIDVHLTKPMDLPVLLDTIESLKKS